jgi:hypothetical protein
MTASARPVLCARPCHSHVLMHNISCCRCPARVWPCCKAGREVRDAQYNVVERASDLAKAAASLTQAAAVAAVLLISPLSSDIAPAEAKTRLSQEEQRVVDLFNKSTSSVVNVTNLSSRCATWRPAAGRRAKHFQCQGLAGRCQAFSTPSGLWNSCSCWRLQHESCSVQSPACDMSAAPILRSSSQCKLTAHSMA